MAAPRIIYIILRRMRPPLLVLLGSYAISLLGMTLIPGIDDQGKPWTMDFFHAYYFLSYTATTIGFGEIPYPFSDPQRAWVLVSIYLTVIAWFYAIGTILSLVQDPALRRVVVRGQFERQVRRIREPFVIVCGFGDTGRALVRALVEHFRQVVVVDIDPEAINELRIKDYPLYVPALAVDATIPENLELAGLKHDLCNGVVIVTPSDEANLKIAITSKLLNEDVPVYSQGESADIEANMASFGTDYIIDPYARFAQQGALAIRSPGIYLLHHWLNAVPHTMAEEPLYPPRGTWILCGYGRFGKSIHNVLRELGIRVVVIEADPIGTGSPPGEVEGSGTEAHTLRVAGIGDAVALVAGTNNDANNLSIVLTARGINPKLFMVVRQNNTENRSLFERSGVDLLMNPSHIVSWEIRVLLTEPLLAEFLEKSKDYDNDWGNRLYSRMLGVVDRMPEVQDCRAPVQGRAGRRQAIVVGEGGDACPRTWVHGPGGWLRIFWETLWPHARHSPILSSDEDGETGEGDREDSRGDQVPAVWSLTIDEHDAAGVVACLNEGLTVQVLHLSLDPRSRTNCMRCLTLMLKRADSKVLLPKLEFRLAIGDQLLFCGGYGLERRMAWMLKDPDGFRYLVTGESEPVSSLGRWLAKRKKKQHEQEGQDGLSDSET